MAGKAKPAPNAAAVVPKPIALGALVWLNQMADFLKKPLISIGFAALSVGLLYVASKEVKLFLYVLEYYGITDRPRDGALYGIMTVALVVFMWLNILLMAYLKDGLLNLVSNIRGKLKFN